MTLPADYTLTLNVTDVCTENPVASIALMAYDACKGGDAVQNTLTYVKCLFSGMELSSADAFSADETAVRAAVENAAAEVRAALTDSELKIGEKAISVMKGAQSVEIDTEAIVTLIMDAFQSGNYDSIGFEAKLTPSDELDVEGLYQRVYAECRDAYFDYELGELVPEVVGVSFDKAQAQRLWAEASYGDEVIIPLVFEQPELTAEHLSETLFRDKLSSLSTSLRGSSANRITNVKRAAESINGMVLQPGAEFDYNKALGKRTAENGYLPAGAYTAEGTVQEYGGGICQVSSTLYYCALYANLKITDRLCHMYPVGYVPAGLDATVSWGGPEFKFVNDREYPVRIVAGVDDETNSISVEIWGTDTDGSYVEMTSSTWYFYDKEYTDVALGYKAQTYRSVYDKDGNLISRKSEAMSTYNYHEEDIKWPEEALEPETPEETPIPEETPAPEETPLPEETPETTPAPEETPTPTPAPENGEI